MAGAAARPTVVVPGPITRHHGQFDAVWAADILAFLHPDLHLVLLGDGPDVDRVRHFVGSCQRERVVHFPGVVADPLPWLTRADVVWIPALRDSGRMATLEAMAAGRPVIASRQPGLSELVVDGETGFLVPPGDKTERCRLTRTLLADPVLAQTMGAAGRRRVTEQFALAALVDRMRERDDV
ncbi:MAG: glycosyltransferase [Gemmataceae bacterium]